jgi:hypothetical protein
MLRGSLARAAALRSLAGKQHPALAQAKGYEVLGGYRGAEAPAFLSASYKVRWAASPAECVCVCVCGGGGTVLGTSAC